MYHGNPEMRMMAAIAIGLDRISIGSVVKSIAISSDRASMDVDGGFDGGFDGRFHLAVLGYLPQQSVRQLRREAFTTISREGLMGSTLNELVILQTLKKAISQEGVKAL
jgi:hypothetical protein